MPKKSTNRYAIRVRTKDGYTSDPVPGLTNYQFAMRLAKEIAQRDGIEAWVVTYKVSSVRKVKG